MDRFISGILTSRKYSQTNNIKYFKKCYIKPKNLIFDFISKKKLAQGKIKNSLINQNLIFHHLSNNKIIPFSSEKIKIQAIAKIKEEIKSHPLFENKIIRSSVDIYLSNYKKDEGLKSCLKTKNKSKIEFQELNINNGRNKAQNRKNESDLFIRPSLNYNKTEERPRISYGLRNSYLKRNIDQFLKTIYNINNPGETSSSKISKNEFQTSHNKNLIFKTCSFGCTTDISHTNNLASTKKYNIFPFFERKLKNFGSKSKTALNQKNQRIISHQDYYSSINLLKDQKHDKNFEVNGKSIALNISKNLKNYDTSRKEEKLNKKINVFL